METAVLNGFTGAEIPFTAVEGFFHASPSAASPPLLVMPGELSAVWQSKIAAFPLFSELTGHLLVRSSGSTGEPKWIAISRHAWFVTADAANAHLQATRADRWALVLPSFHVGGLAILARAARVGSKVIPFPASWQAAAFREWAEREGITLCSLVPAQVFDLVKEGWTAPASLRAILVGGGALSPHLYEAARSLGWPVLPSYGMTETASQVATASLETLGAAIAPLTLPLLPIWEVATSSAGLLKIRGPGLAAAVLSWKQSGRWNREALTDEEGWFTTKDKVQIQPESPASLTFMERADEVVKIRGELVSIVALERKIDSLLAGHPALSRTALCAMPHPRNGHDLILVTEVPIEEELAQEIRRLFPRFAPLVNIVILRQLPRAALGKILRAKLLQLVISAMPD